MSLRAIGWNDEEAPNPLKSLPNSQDRKTLARETSNFTLRYSTPENPPYNPKFIDVERLLLSSQGAYAKLHADWKVEELQNLPDSNVAEWHQETIWSRDQYVKISKLFYGAPFGFPVFSVTVRRREFVGDIPGVEAPVAILKEYYFCTTPPGAVANFDFPKDGNPDARRGCNFRSFEILPPFTTPLLARPPEELGGWMVLSSAVNPQNPTDDEIFKFKVKATDWKTPPNISMFELPFWLIDKEISENNGPIDSQQFKDTKQKLLDLATSYNNNWEPRRTANLGGQKVAFAPESGDSAEGRDPALETSKITFSIVAYDAFPPDWREFWKIYFFPRTSSAIVRLAQTAAFDTGGAAGGAMLTYNPQYLSGGFSHKDDANKTVNGNDVFADIENASLGFAGDKSGGLCTPSINITNISRTFGPVGGKQTKAGRIARIADSNAMVKGTFDPASFFAAAKLIGGVDLAEVIESVAEAYNQISRVPKLIAEAIDEFKSARDVLTKSVNTIHDLLNFKPTTFITALRDAIRAEVIQAVENVTADARTQFIQLTLQELPNFDAIKQAVTDAATTALSTVLAGDELRTAANKFTSAFLVTGDEWKILAQVYAALRDPGFLEVQVTNAFSKIDEFGKQAEEQKQRVISQAIDYFLSRPFAEALASTKFDSTQLVLRQLILFPLTTYISPIPGVDAKRSEDLLNLLINDREVLVELAATWRDPARLKDVIKTKIQGAFSELAQDGRQQLRAKVDDYFAQNAANIAAVLKDKNKSLIQFRSYILAKLSNQGLEAQIGFADGALNALGIRDFFEKELGYFDGVLQPARDFLPNTFRQLQNKIERLRDDLSDPMKMTGELKRTLNDLQTTITSFGTTAQAVLDVQKSMLARVKNDVVNEATQQISDKADAYFSNLEQQASNLRAEIQSEVQVFLDDRKKDVVDRLSKYQGQLTGLCDQWVSEGAPVLMRMADASSEIAKNLNEALKAISDLWNLEQSIEKLVPKEIAVDYTWTPQLKSGGPFEARRDSVPATFTLNARVRKSLALGELGQPPSVRIEGRLKDFQLKLFPSSCFIIVAFKELSFVSVDGNAPNVTVGIDRVTFGEALKFVQELAKALSPDSGFFLELESLGLTAGYRFPLPKITSGGFNLIQLSINVGVSLPFDGSPVRVKLSLSTRQTPFLLSVGILGGGGFFGVTLSGSGVEKLEGSLEFGAIAALDLVVASGTVYICAGIYFAQSGEHSSLYGFVRAGGSMRVLGLITVTVQFYLGVGYESRDGKSLAVGEATLTIEIEMLFFSVSVDLHYRKEFEGSSGGSSERLNAFKKQSQLAPVACDRLCEYKAFQANWPYYRTRFYDPRTAKMN